MKSTKHYISIFLLYLGSINFYFALWYMGSEGHAMDWSVDALTFLQLLGSTNLAGLFTFIVLICFSRYLDQSSFGQFGPIKAVTVLSWLVAGSLFLLFLAATIDTMMHEEVVLQYIRTFGFLSLSIYHFTILLLFVLLLNLSRRLGGSRKVFEYFFKPFNAPSQLDRGFMFLDLNTSTTIAEKLGNQHYSQFIRKCFQLLDQALDDHEGIEIYQYVGDEAILHWNFNDRATCQKALNLFYEYKTLLQMHAGHFENMFQVSPTFKAALHGGPVVKSEFGSKAIHTAFHGDVLNTASRMLNSCHRYHTDVLISESYFKKLNLPDSTRSYQQIDDVTLNGKLHKLTVYKPLLIDKHQENNLL